MRTFAALLLIGMTGALTAPAAAQEQAGSCTPRISSAGRVERGDLLQMRYTACAAGRIRMGLVALEDAHRGKLVLRKTITLDRAGSGTAALVIGALQTGRYRLVLIDAGGRVWRASHEVRVVSAPTWPPASSGCGDDGPTMSSSRPTVRLTSTTLRLRDTGRVRIHLRGNQTAATTVTIAQVGGKRVGGTRAGGYTCTTPRNGIVALPLNAYGRRLVQRHGRLAVKITFRLINGSGVTNKRVLPGVIKPE